MSLLLTEELIQKAKQSIEEIEQGISTNDSLIHNMFASKGAAIRFLADQYEILSESNTIPLEKNQIANFLMKRLQELNVNFGVSWAYDSLPSKYKNHRVTQGIDDDYSVKRNEDSSLYTDYEAENKLEITFLDSYINLLKQRITTLKKEPYYSLLEPEQYREYYIIRGTAFKMLEDVLDNRKTVPVNTIHLLYHVYDTLNLKKAAGEYIVDLKKFGAEKKDGSINEMKKLFDPKQLGKILSGHVRELHISQEPQTQEDAYENGFYGKCNCEECGSWRIVLQTSYNPKTGTFANSQLYCFACGLTTKPPRVKLPMSHPTPQITEEKVF